LKLKKERKKERKKHSFKVPLRSAHTRFPRAPVGFRKLLHARREAAAQFADTELTLALTFCRIAQNTTPDRARRLAAKAKRAYETAKQTLRGSPAAPRPSRGIASQLKRVEKCLNELAKRLAAS